MQFFKRACMRSLQLRRIAAVATAVLVLSCGAATSPEAPVCDQVCAISNGASASGATTYWRIDGVSCGQLGCFTKIAFFADGTGELTSGTNNCTMDFGGAPNFPDVVTFAWTKTGSSTMLLSGSAFSCSPAGNTTGGTIIG